MTASGFSHSTQQSTRSGVLPPSAVHPHDGQNGRRYVPMPCVVLQWGQLAMLSPCSGRIADIRYLLGVERTPVPERRSNVSFCKKTVNASLVRYDGEYIMRKNEFVEFVIGDQLAEISGMSAKPMFSGFGIYREGTIVGIVIEDELYLKVDASNEAKYRAMGSEPFSYERKDGKQIAMSYWKIPSQVLEDRDRLTELVEESYEINLKKSLKKTAAKKKKTKPRQLRACDLPPPSITHPLSGAAGLFESPLFHELREIPRRRRVRDVEELLHLVVRHSPAPLDFRHDLGEPLCLFSRDPLKRHREILFNVVLPDDHCRCGGRGA